MNEFEQHDTIWDDRLQDLLDGDLESSERATVESHLSTCARCRRRYSRLKRLDSQLTSKLHAPLPDPCFDRQLFARIEALDAHSRDQARRQADHELQENLRALTRDWQRRIALLLGGAIAGMAVALAFAGWADTAVVTDKLLGALNTFSTDAEAARSVMTAMMGAIIGAGVSGLVAKSID